MVESTLEDFCHRYLSTPDDLYLYNTSRVTAEGFAQFRQRVEHDRGPFQVGMPLEERAQIWMDVVLGANQTIQQAIDTHHNRLQTATETPITPEIVWRAAANAPFREASLVQSAGGLNDDAPDRATLDRRVPVKLPLHVGAIQAPVHVAPSGTVTVDPMPDWMVSMRHVLEILEVYLDRMEHAVRQVGQARDRVAETCQLAYFTAILTHIARDASPLDARLNTIANAADHLSDAARATIAGAGATARYASIVNTQRTNAETVNRLLHHNAALRGHIDHLDTVIAAHGSGTEAAYAGPMKEWVNRLTQRAIRALDAIDGDWDLIRIITEATPDTIGNLAGQYPASPAAGVIGTAANVSSQFTGNAGGASNVYVSAAHTWVYRKLAGGSLNGAVLNTDEALSWVRKFGQKFGSSEASMAAAEAAIRGVNRRGLESAVRDMTTRINTGGITSGTLFVLTGVMLIVNRDAANAQPTWTNQVNYWSSWFGTASAGIQVWVNLRTAAGAAARFTGFLQTAGNIAGAIAGIGGLIVSTMQLVDYFWYTNPADMTVGKVLSLELSFIGSAVLVASYFMEVPGGQFAGGVITVASIVIGFIADRQGSIDFWNGPLMTLLSRLLDRVKHTAEYTAVVRPGSTIANLATTLETALGSCPRFLVVDMSVLARSQDPAAVKRQLMDLGIAEAGADQLIQPVNDPVQQMHDAEMGD